jgi:hypothetical protein
MVSRILTESQTELRQGKYESGAIKVEQAARVVQARPQLFPEQTAVELVSKTVDFLERESASAKARGDNGAASSAMSAEQRLRRHELCKLRTLHGAGRQLVHRVRSLECALNHSN